MTGATIDATTAWRALPK